MRRRDFIKVLASSASAWPFAVRAQQQLRRIGILMNLAADDTESAVRVAAFAKGLQELGWIDGQNVRLDYRWGAGNADRFRAYAAELVALAPDVIVAASSPAVAALQQATHSVPIVFVQVIDPVGGGFVASRGRRSGPGWRWSIISTKRWATDLQQKRGASARSFDGGYFLGALA